MYSAGNFAALPNGELEVQTLRRYFSKTMVLQGERATCKNIFTRSKAASAIHVASHGLWNAEAYSSGLPLFGYPNSDGFLSVARVLAKGDLRGIGLVMLSACTTGLSVVPFGRVENYLGIDGAFLARGARSTIATLWEIHDLAGLLFMQAFYRAMCDGDPVGIAHAKAVRFLRNREYLSSALPDELDEAIEKLKPGWRQELQTRRLDFGDPFYWASFKSSGWTWGGAMMAAP